VYSVPHALLQYYYPSLPYSDDYLLFLEYLNSANGRSNSFRVHLCLAPFIILVGVLFQTQLQHAEEY
jgi:hypothetical protein